MALSDTEAKRILRTWPTTTQTWSPPSSAIWWLRAQPADGTKRAPRLIVPGSQLFHTQPDGLWITLGIGRSNTQARASYADCLVVEVCGSSQNFSDKRSRYAARTTALVLDMRQPWLDGEVVLRGRGGVRRKRRDVLQGNLPADGAVALPVRHLRVIYSLDDVDGGDSLYSLAVASVPLEAHEYLCPQRVLGQWNAQPMQSFVKGIRPSLQHY